MYKKICKQCKCEFPFNKENIVINTYMSIKNNIIDKIPIIKRRLLNVDYSGIVTIKKITYDVKYTYIQCLLCGHKNTIKDKIKETKIDEIIEVKTETATEMFGSNPPYVVGEQNAINAWLAR